MLNIQYCGSATISTHVIAFEYSVYLTDFVVADIHVLKSIHFPMRQGMFFEQVGAVVEWMEMLE